MIIFSRQSFRTDDAYCDLPAVSVSGSISAPPGISTTKRTDSQAGRLQRLQRQIYLVAWHPYPRDRQDLYRAAIYRKRGGGIFPLPALSEEEEDQALVRDFYTALDEDKMRSCIRCQEHWLDMKRNSFKICSRCVSRDTVHDVGLNTIRVPIGYWSYTQIVDKASEPFANGNHMLPYLNAVVGKAADLGTYVIIHLHGAPGGQQDDVFTGQNNKPVGFDNDYNFGRAEQWFSTVGMLEVLNEPAIRYTESNLGVAHDRKLHFQLMSGKWDSGDARTASAVANDPMTSFDDHNYIGFALGNNAGDQYRLMHSAWSDSRVVWPTLCHYWRMEHDFQRGLERWGLLHKVLHCPATPVWESWDGGMGVLDLEDGAERPQVDLLVCYVPQVHSDGCGCFGEEYISGCMFWLQIEEEAEESRIELLRVD
ncbi:hypothetical protein AK830_g5074 [Neonectria ditissima]|uniref:glucan endo-1,6-beta-glucosidase n=1 Tax=Neonectria ditissima TaxID=78410 RepID=A0A0P7BEY9_9HYPO|nr:hypothetical protein AK830_g5074 [Neonectria ditissima]